MRIVVICFCFLGIICVILVKQVDFGSFEEKQFYNKYLDVVVIWLNFDLFQKQNFLVLQNVVFFEEINDFK